MSIPPPLHWVRRRIFCWEWALWTTPPGAVGQGGLGPAFAGVRLSLMLHGWALVNSAFTTNTLVVFINQLRHKIGVTFGSPETTTGGNALKYFASVRLDIRRIATVRDGEDAVANRCRVKVVKNKCAPPFTEAQFEIAFGTGIDRDAEILDWALGRNIVTKAGSWFSLGDIRVGQGRAAALEWLRNHPTERDGLLARAMTDLAVPTSGAPAEEEEARAA
ncbi:hypothetical protein OV203_32310 [Nannocystis sp. ILAH1]|uniref:hypothetical protein n=1 Tax=Nannocystis sp. ILAH1 TaxID=2996789 RepID=UPI0022700276|nr:hypothetical protein [Nannocystis sp. ILAH1]MCY0991867.1 hypothetical protein [Nannocystis sp. ILAH1]